MKAPDNHKQANILLARIAFGLLAFSLVAFALKAAVHTEVQARYTTLVIIHAATMLAWTGLLGTQAWLAANERFSLHRLLGKSSLGLVAVMTVTGLILAVNIGEELGRVEVTIVNLAAFATFLPLYIAAIRFAARKEIARHRMAMLIGTLAFMTPAYARVVQVLGLPDPLAIAVQVPITVAIALGFDWKTQGRFTWSTLAMLAFSIAIIVVMVASLIPLIV
ncbi:MAG: hypothetical protein AAFY42_01840 [Pseudomonadota bacterium]